MFRKVVIISILILSIITISLRDSMAEELPIYNVLTNSVYGGVIGVLLGTAVLAFTNKPSDHLNFIARGASIGIFAGTIYGLYETSHSVAEVKEGKMSLHLPDIRPEIVSSADNKLYPQIKAGIFKYSF